MDSVVVTEKLESLRRCIRRVEEKCPAKLEDLVSDPDLQDILVLNLTRAVQLCVDIGSHIISNSEQVAPQTMGEIFPALAQSGFISNTTSDKLRKAVGFRNIAVHNYQTISWEVVHAVSTHSLEDFKSFAKDVSQLLGEQ